MPTPEPVSAAPSDAPASDRQQTLALIAREARAQGVPPRLAVAFADIESGLNPRAEGDLQWHLLDGGQRYRENVLNKARLSRNPWRNQPERWHSYGLFQLLAPYFVEPTEDPRVLLDPVINTQRAMRRIRTVLEESDGDVMEARRRYVGCGPGSKCARERPERVAQVDAAWAKKLRKWEVTA